MINVHTEHCSSGACKYGDKSCPVRATEMPSAGTYVCVKGTEHTDCGCWALLHAENKRLHDLLAERRPADGPSQASCANCFDSTLSRSIGCRQCQPGELDESALATLGKIRCVLGLEGTDDDLVEAVRSLIAASDSSSPAASLADVRRAVQAVLGWQPGWCADCEPLSERTEHLDHHEETCGYREARDALCALLDLPHYREIETAEQVEGKPGYRRHRFGGKLDQAAPFTSGEKS